SSPRLIAAIRGRLAIRDRAIVETYAADERPVARVGSNRIQPRMHAQQHESRRLLLHGQLQPAVCLVDVTETRVHEADAPRRHDTLRARRRELVENAPRLRNVPGGSLEMRKPERRAGN